MAHPKPRIVKEVCSVCGLDWRRHGKEPTLETCVRPLLDEVRDKERALAARPLVVDRSYPYPVSPRPYWPHWYTTWRGSTISASSSIAAQYTSGSLSPSAVQLPSGSVV